MITGSRTPSNWIITLVGMGSNKQDLLHILLLSFRTSSRDRGLRIAVYEHVYGNGNGEGNEFRNGNHTSFGSQRKPMVVFNNFL